MRLWHYNLIVLLPRQQLLGQHRECCALRGKGWGKKHSVVNYVFSYSYDSLYNYHLEVMNEMERRGYNPNPIWKRIEYRGKIIGYDFSFFTKKLKNERYKEHNDKYLRKCIDNLKEKGVNIQK